MEPIVQIKEEDCKDGLQLPSYDPPRKKYKPGPMQEPPRSLHTKVSARKPNFVSTNSKKPNKANVAKTKKLPFSKFLNKRSSFQR